MLKLQPFRDTTASKSNQQTQPSSDDVSHITRKVAALNINNNNTADKENRVPEGKTFVSSAWCPDSPATPKRKPLGLIDSPGPKPKDYVYYTSELAPGRKPLGSAANQANTRKLKPNDPAKRKLVLMR
ncbi:hypothetical protein CJU90_4366 [Yarrowia sp. C11]|nr:hypothetical protein CKK34_6648 [Yarrowia sp. E02]KAG5365297.1 hypothetical protein CJU90_4366 [Yarrowia sp. C11]